MRQLESLWEDYVQCFAMGSINNYYMTGKLESPRLEYRLQLISVRKHEEARGIARG